MQRSRDYVRASEQLGAAGDVRFPRRAPPRVTPYHLKITYGRLLESVATAFDREAPLFALAIYNPLSYLVAPPDAQDFEVGRQKQVVAPIRTLFLKRFESSAKAFELSCIRLLRCLLAWAEIHATRAGRRSRPSSSTASATRPTGNTSSWADDDDAAEFVTEDDREAVLPLDPQRYRVGDMFDDTIDDLEQVADFLSLVHDVRPERDAKLTALAKLLQNDKDVAGRKVIVFTEFSDTAAYLETHLRAKGLHRLERIDGTSAARSSAGPRRSTTVPRRPTRTSTCSSPRTSLPRG